MRGWSWWEKKGIRHYMKRGSLFRPHVLEEPCPILTFFVNIVQCLSLCPEHKVLSGTIKDLSLYQTPNIM